MALELLAEPELLLSPPVRRRTVLTAVGAIDRRAVHALRCAELVPATRRAAVHAGPLDEVGEAWSTCFPDGPPLELVAGDDVAAAVAGHARLALADGADEVVVVLGRLAGRGLRRRLLHDRSADAIAAAVDAIPGALALIVVVEPQGSNR